MHDIHYFRGVGNWEAGTHGRLIAVFDEASWFESLFWIKRPVSFNYSSLEQYRSDVLSKVKQLQHTFYHNGAESAADDVLLEVQVADMQEQLSFIDKTIASYSFSK